MGKTRRFDNKGGMKFKKAKKDRTREREEVYVRSEAYFNNDDDYNWEADLEEWNKKEQKKKR